MSAPFCQVHGQFIGLTYHNEKELFHQPKEQYKPIQNGAKKEAKRKLTKNDLSLITYSGKAKR